MANLFDLYMRSLFFKMKTFWIYLPFRYRGCRLVRLTVRQWNFPWNFTRWFCRLICTPLYKNDQIFSVGSKLNPWWSKLWRIKIFDLTWIAITIRLIATKSQNLTRAKIWNCILINNKSLALPHQITNPNPSQGIGDMPHKQHVTRHRIVIKTKIR